MQSSDSTDKTTDASKEPSSPESSDDDSKTESKWTPLPPPNMEAILAKMPLIPLTLEQLCAPTSEDEEEEQVKEIGQNSTVRQSNPTTTHSILVQNNLEKDVSLGLRDNTMPVSSSDTMTSSSNTSTVNTNQSISHSIKTAQQQSGNYSKKSQIKSTKMSTKPPNPKVLHIDLTDQEKPCTSNSDHPTASRSKNIFSQRDEQSLLANSNKDLPMPTHLTDSSDLETNFDILCKNIDLDITKEEKPCTSSSGWKSNSSSSNKMENQTTNINLTDYSEIDHLCKDIDFDTINDFSDTETEIKSHSSCSTGKGKGKASCNGQRNIQKSVADSSSNVTPQEPEFVGRGKSATFQSNVTSSISKTSSSGERTSSQVTQKNNTVSSSQPTSTIHPSTTSKYAGSKRPNDLDHVLSRSKKPRLEISRQPHYSKHVTTSTSKKSSNLSNTGRMNHIVSHRHNITLPITTRTPSLTHQSCDTLSEPAATLKQSSLSSLSQQTSNHGITILQQNTSHKSTQQSTTIHNSIPQQVKAQAMPHTVHDHSATNTARAMPRTTQPMPVVTPRAALHNVNTPTNSRTTPLGSQLTADKCPMCNTKFPSWYASFSLVLDVECMYTCHRYEQVDADQHIARCLQAVMDLEIENDLVLL